MLAAKAKIFQRRKKVTTASSRTDSAIHPCPNLIA